jgi:hypothetical protein
VVVDISDPDNQDPPPPVTVQEAVQYAEGLSRFLQEQPNTFDSGSQSRCSAEHRLQSEQAVGGKPDSQPAVMYWRLLWERAKCRQEGGLGAG